MNATMSTPTGIHGSTALAQPTSGANGASPLWPSAAPPLTAASALASLRSWADAGCLRRLDHALAALVAELDPTASPAVLVATALLANMEGRGHTCLPLIQAIHPASHWLDWPATALQQCQALCAQLPQTEADWAAALKASAVVRDVSTAPDQGQPLVLAGPPGALRLYLRRHWDLERQVAHHVLARCAPMPAVDRPAVRAWLARLFDAPVGGALTKSPASANQEAQACADAHASPEHVNWQQLACGLAVAGRLSVITGGPGTGKTYTAARLLALLLALHPEPATLRVALAAPTGKAAARLRQSIASSLDDVGPRLGPAVDTAGFVQRLGAAKTLHALLGTRGHSRRFVHNAHNPLELDVLVVDEASMVHLDMMAAVLDALPLHAQLVLMGDKDQLASVEAGAVLAELCRDASHPRYSADTVRFAQAATGQNVGAWQCPPGGVASPVAQRTVMLRQSHRFQGPIGQLAQAVNHGNVAHARQALAQDVSGALHAEFSATPADVVRLAVSGRPGTNAHYTTCFQGLGQQPSGNDMGVHRRWVHHMLTAFDRFRLLCAVREGAWGVAGLNAAVEHALGQARCLRPHTTWYAGRPVMVTRNDPGLGVFNGDIGLTLPAADSAQGLRVFFRAGDELHSVGVNRLSFVDTAFAMTVHKSQGSEFEHTALVLPAHAPQVLSRQLLYTGITRARQHLSLLSPSAEVFEQGVLREVSRWGGLGSLLAANGDDSFHSKQTMAEKRL